MSRRNLIRSTPILGTVALVLAGLSFAPAAAEQSGAAGVKVSFNPSYSPNHIPRHRLVPIHLSLEGSVRSDLDPPPRLRRIEIAFGARGGLDVEGLPVCSRAQLRYATQRQALARCRDALVGRGEIDAEVPFDPEHPVMTAAGVLVFNGRFHGRPAAWAHAYSASPPVSFVLPFYLRRPSTGTYGVSMSSPVGSALGRWPRLRSFRITLWRRYTAGGRSHSYLSAHCPLAQKFDHLPVPFARATYHFAPRPLVLTQPIRRFCTVRE